MSSEVSQNIDDHILWVTKRIKKSYRLLCSLSYTHKSKRLLTLNAPKLLLLFATVQLVIRVKVDLYRKEYERMWSKEKLIDMF